MASTPRRQDLDLGISTWINRNPTIALEHQLLPNGSSGGPSSGIYEAPELKRILEVSGNNEDGFVLLGVEARGYGCMEDIEPRQVYTPFKISIGAKAGYMDLTPKPSRAWNRVGGHMEYIEPWRICDPNVRFQAARSLINVLPKVSRGWDRVDGTMPRGPADDQERLQHGLYESLRTGPVDTVLQCAILLNAGRIQHDQMCAAQYVQVPDIAVIMRRIVAKPWGLMDSYQRDSLRNILVSAIAGLDPDRFNTYGPIPIAEVFDACFSNLPQLSFTVTQRWYENGRYNYAQSGEQRTGLVIVRRSDNATSLVEAFEDIFRGFAKTQAIRTVTLDDTQPRGTPVEELILFDRPPPVLFLIWKPGDSENPQTPAPLEDVPGWYTFNFPLVSGWLTTEYVPMGFVLDIGNTHFIIRWSVPIPDSIDTEIRSYHSYLVHQPERVKTWWDNLPRDARIVASFMRLTRTSVTIVKERIWV